MKRAVADVVKEQVKIGIDVPSDGEMSKFAFSNYVDERMTGFEPRPSERLVLGGRDRKAFPEFYEILDGGTTVGSTSRAMVCTSPVRFEGKAIVERDLDNFKRALAAVSVTEAFVPAIAPGTVAAIRENSYYKTDEEFLYAIAEALAPEYKAIVDSGFILQIDDPRMVTAYDAMDPEPSVAEYQKFANVRVDAINHAIAGLPADRDPLPRLLGQLARSSQHRCRLGASAAGHLPAERRGSRRGGRQPAARPRVAAVRIHRAPRRHGADPRRHRGTPPITSSIPNTSRSASCSTRRSSGGRT